MSHSTLPASRIVTPAEAPVPAGPPPIAAGSAGAAGLPSASALFAPLEPFDHGMLEVGDGHRLYYEQCGAPAGMPVLFLHGGPGSGCSVRHRQLLDPARFRVVLFDQRGCGRSTPRGSIEANSTAHLVADIEHLRRHLALGQWLVFGGSWGSSLALAYCAQHPDRCLGAILRGIFLTGRADIEWFFHGAGAVLLDAWAELVAAPVPGAAIANHYLATACGPDRDAAIAAVERWMQWEADLSAADGAAPRLAPLEGPALEAALDKYRVQAHYLAHECFLGESTVLGNAAGMAAIPTAILHGRCDRVCRPENAVKLQRALPGSRLRLIAGAGHNPFDPPMTAALIDAANHFHAHGDFAAWEGDVAGTGSPPPEGGTAPRPG